MGHIKLTLERYVDVADNKRHGILTQERRAGEGEVAVGIDVHDHRAVSMSAP